MFWTTASLSCATASCSAASSAQDSQSFLLLPATFTVTSSSTSSPQDLQTGMGALLTEAARPSTNFRLSLVRLVVPARPQHDRDARARLWHFRDAVLPGALAGSAHDQKVAPPQGHRERWSTSCWPQHEAPRRSEGNRGDHRLRHVARDAIAMPRHAVVAIA